MEPESSLPPSQAPATCPYPEPGNSSSYAHPTSWRSIFNIIFQATPRSSSSFFRDVPPKHSMHLSCLSYSWCPTKTLYAPLLPLILATPRPTYSFYHENNNIMKMYSGVHNMYHSVIMKTTIIIIYCNHILVHVKTVSVIIQLLFIV